MAVIFLSTCPETLWLLGHFGHILCPASGPAKPVFCEVGRWVSLSLCHRVAWREHQGQPMPTSSEQRLGVSHSVVTTAPQRPYGCCPQGRGCLPRPPASPPSRTLPGKGSLGKGSPSLGREIKVCCWWVFCLFLMFREEEKGLVTGSFLDCACRT